jgi:hypothetical protein
MDEIIELNLADNNEHKAESHDLLDTKLPLSCSCREFTLIYQLYRA